MTGAAALPTMAAILAGGAAGAWMLRRAWRMPAGKGPWRAGGLTLIGLSLVWPGWALGPARGSFTALALVAVAALAVIAAGAERRVARPGRAPRGLAPEPADRAASAWRTGLRWALAGPIGMVAAMAIGISYAVWAPGAIQTRLLIGGLIVPVAWGAAMAWTLADSRILRATAVLLGTAILGFGAASLKGLA